MCVDISLSVHFQCSHEANIQPAIIIKVKLVGHIINRRRTDHGSERLSGYRESTDSSGLNSKRHHIQHTVLSCMSGNHFRNTDPDIHNVIQAQLHCCPPADDISDGVVLRSFRRNRIDLLIPHIPLFIRNLKASGQSGIRFIPFFRFCHNNCVHKAPRYDCVSRTGRCIHKTVHLHDHLSMIRLDRLTDGQCITGHKHIIKRNISFTVCCRSLDQRNCKFRQLIIEELLPIHFDMFYQRIIDRNPIDSRPFHSRIHENIQPHLGKCSRQSARLCTNRMGNTAQRQIICLKPILQYKLLRTHHSTKMATDQSVYSALPNIPFRITVFIPHTETGTGNNRQMSG